jgi:hypothetical protein
MRETRLSESPLRRAVRQSRYRFDRVKKDLWDASKRDVEAGTFLYGTP